MGIAELEVVRRGAHHAARRSACERRDHHALGAHEGDRPAWTVGSDSPAPAAAAAGTRASVRVANSKRHTSQPGRQRTYHRHGAGRARRCRRPGRGRHARSGVCTVRPADRSSTRPASSAHTRCPASSATCLVSLGGVACGETAAATAAARRGLKAIATVCSPLREVVDRERDRIVERDRIGAAGRQRIVRGDLIFPVAVVLRLPSKRAGRLNRPVRWRNVPVGSAEPCRRTPSRHRRRRRTRSRSLRRATSR